MEHSRHLHSTSTSIFFTLALAPPAEDLLQDIDLLHTALRQIRAAFPFTADAWVVLPDHLHMIWTLPPGDAGHALRWGLIARRFAAARLARHPDAAPLLDRIWEHRLRDTDDFSRHLRLCAEDPVRHGFVYQAQDWPYSSAYQRPRLRLVR